MNRREYARREAWMTTYQNTLQAELPAVAGRICWDTATFFYNQGTAAEDAAHQHANTLREQWAKAPLNTF